VWPLCRRLGDESPSTRRLSQNESRTETTDFTTENDFNKNELVATVDEWWIKESSLKQQTATDVLSNECNNFTLILQVNKPKKRLRITSAETTAREALLPEIQGITTDPLLFLQTARELARKDVTLHKQPHAAAACFRFKEYRHGEK
jgi:hypothetical protein